MGSINSLLSYVYTLSKCLLCSLKAWFLLCTTMLFTASARDGITWSKRPISCVHLDILSACKQIIPYLGVGGVVVKDFVERAVHGTVELCRVKCHQ